MKKLFSSSDKLGIWASGLCLVHCISFPLLVALFPVLQVTDYIEIIFLSISVFAVYFSTKRGKSLPLKLSMWSILAVLAVSVLLDDHSKISADGHHHETMVMGINTQFFEILSYISALGLAITHYFSQRRYRSCAVK